MKHLAQIQGEFLKYSADQLSWWESMDPNAQREYLKRHPGSKMRLTPARTSIKPDPKPGEVSYRDEYESPETMELKRKIVQKMMRKLIRHPGDAHINSRVDGEGNLQYDLIPGLPRVPGDQVLRKQDGKLHRTHSDGFTQEPLEVDEAASTLRHHMGEEDVSHMTKSKKQQREAPVELPAPEKTSPKWMEHYNPRTPENYDPSPSSLSYSD